MKLVIKVLLIFFSANFFQTFFSSIGARCSRAQIYHQEKNKPLSVQFQNFSNYQMRISYAKGVGITQSLRFIEKSGQVYRDDGGLSFLVPVVERSDGHELRDVFVYVSRSVIGL